MADESRLAELVERSNLYPAFLCVFDALDVVPARAIWECAELVAEYVDEVRDEIASHENPVWELSVLLAREMRCIRSFGKAEEIAVKALSTSDRGQVVAWTMMAMAGTTRFRFADVYPADYAAWTGMSKLAPFMSPYLLVPRLLTQLDRKAAVGGLAS